MKNNTDIALEALTRQVKPLNVTNVTVARLHNVKVVQSHTGWTMDQVHRGFRDADLGYCYLPGVPVPEASHIFRVTLSKRLVVVVWSLAQAQAKVRQFISDQDLGANDWYGMNKRNAAGLVTMDREAIARVSYNGRAWTLEGEEILESEV